MRRIISPECSNLDFCRESSLGILYVLYGFFAYTAQRYGNNPDRITGTGLAALSGF